LPAMPLRPRWSRGARFTARERVRAHAA
jgi:hypothetical protein